MDQVNSIVENLYSEEVKFPLDVIQEINYLQEVKEKHNDNSKDQLLFGENSYNVSHTVSGIKTIEAIGYHNTKLLFTGRGNDRIIGLGTATISEDLQEIAYGESNAFDTASVDTSARAEFKAATVLEVNEQTVLEPTVFATGVKNSNKIITAKGDDQVIGVANFDAVVDAFADSKAIDLSQATANSEAKIYIAAEVIGVENNGDVSLGQGQDLFAGIANTSTQATAQATALANAFDVKFDAHTSKQLNEAKAEAQAIAEAFSQVDTVGIDNRNNIFLNSGNDIVFGLAQSQSSSQADADAQAASRANQAALANPNAEAISIAITETFGIANSGLLATGWGNDTVIGLAFNQSEAGADADALANGVADTAGADTNTVAKAEISQATVIGINNLGGRIDTGVGKDKLIAYGDDIGISGGKIRLGDHNDHLQSTGGYVGVDRTSINLGSGHDYFQAEVGELDPLTGAGILAEDRTNSIRNSQVYGSLGNDIFELGGFSGNVLIHGGSDFDTLKLAGEIDSYDINAHGASARTITIENADSILTVTSVEAIYFGDSEVALSVDDFA